jgi:hypothetical protein
LIVNPEFALGQLEQEPIVPGTGVDEAEAGGEEPVPSQRVTTHFHGVVRLDPTRPLKDFGRTAQEVIEHLTGLVDADVEITVEIDASRAEGLPDEVARTVMENARTLKFERQELD